LSDWLGSGLYNVTIADILQLHGINFFSGVSAVTQDESFLQALIKGFGDYKFKGTTPSQWLSLLDPELGLLQTYQDLKQMEDLPAFRFGDMQTNEVTSGDQVKYQVSFEVSNAGNKQGILDIYTTFLNLEENRGGGFSQWMYRNINHEENGESRLFMVPAQKKVKIELMFDQIPRNVKVQTGVARNIPPWYNYFPGNFKKNGSASHQEGVRVLGEASMKKEETNVFVVDNEDPGFRINSKDEIKTLKDWWVRRQGTAWEEYKSMNFWRPPVTWSSGFGDNYYGDYKRSAVQKVAGNGEDVVQWRTDLPEAGNYEVQVYIPSNLQRSWRHRNVKAGFSYKIYSANGEDQVDSPAVNESTGWISLGRFFFNKGEAIVELSDRTNFPYVVADAVKWIKQ
jgi:hypothetical protein